jgi:murein DD-endopeptidase MepM/ murein hydrolase activator NlpD
MKFQSLAVSLAALIVAASPSTTVPAPADTVPVAAAVISQTQERIHLAFDEPDSEDPGSEDRFIDTWFPAVKPEPNLVDLDAGDAIRPVNPEGIPDIPLDAQYQVEPGDTFKAVLLRAGIAPDDAERAIQALTKVYDARRLQPGIEIFLQLQPQKRNRVPLLLSIDFIADPETDVSVVRESDGGFSATTYERSLTPRLSYGRASITSSLYEAGQAAGIPSVILTSLVNLYSFDIDFQRDVQPGDSFEIIYQRMTEEGGAVVMEGDVTMASMTLSGVKTTLYRFKTRSGYADYFDEEGQSAQKSLLRTPTDAARISSGFGSRRHPVLGYNRMHRGIDFAAPPGTPVYAAGDGVIEKAGWAGAYGKYIRIRHGGSFKTAYAHLRGFAGGISEGTRVKQRQVIGYIGSTGRATGPHLHYEVIQDGDQVNPQTLRLAAGYRLKGEELEDFKKSVAKVHEQVEAFGDRTARKEN